MSAKNRHEGNPQQQAGDGSGEAGLFGRRSEGPLFDYLAARSRTPPEGAEDPTDAGWGRLGVERPGGPRPLVGAAATGQLLRVRYPRGGVARLRRGRPGGESVRRCGTPQGNKERVQGTVRARTRHGGERHETHQPRKDGLPRRSPADQGCGGGRRRLERRAPHDCLEAAGACSTSRSTRTTRRWLAVTPR